MAGYYDEIENIMEKMFQKTLVEIYYKIDIQCISETAAVRMSSVKDVLASYGANPEDME